MAKIKSAINSDNAAVLAQVKAEFAAKRAAVTPVEEACAEVIGTSPELEAAEADVAAWRAVMHDAINSLTPGAGWARTCVAWVVSMTAALGTGYLVGLAMSALLITATVSASTFLTAMVWVIGMLIAMWGGSKVAALLFSGVIDGVIEAPFVSAYKSVAGWFTTAKPRAA